MILPRTAAVAQTQNSNIYEQLCYCGVRYVDVQVTTVSGEIIPSNAIFWHGYMQGCALEEVLKQIVDFLQNRQKFVLLDIVPEYGRDFDFEHVRACLQALSEMLAPVIW
jgi:hypothetical protein